MPSSDPHEAFYDDEGNIVLPESEEIVDWTNGKMLDEAETIPGNVPVHTTLENLQHFTRETVEEGIREYEATFASAEPMLEELEEETGSFFARTWHFLTQPVWIHGTKESPEKPMGRGKLFVFDVIRFGGTFAGIFVVLFVALNYQSFWEIGLSQLSPFIATPSLEQEQKETTLTTTLKGNDGNQSISKAGLLAFLPDIGPPDNRLIVAKLGLNVPIVDPPAAAMLQQDWGQVEKDIQAGLEEGVVHYPGTAKAGQAGNFFITGHSSYYAWSKGKYKSVFARLSQLEPGDEYWVYYGGDKHRYRVRAKQEVSPTDVTVLDQPGNRRMSTLMTCTPVGTALRRLIIAADEVDPQTGITLQVGERSKVETQKVQLEALPI